MNLPGFVTGPVFLWQSLLGDGNESFTGPDSEIHRLSPAIRQQHSQRAEETLSRSGPRGFFKSRIALNIFNPSLEDQSTFQSAASHIDGAIIKPSFV